MTYAVTTHTLVSLVRKFLEGITDSGLEVFFSFRHIFMIIVSTCESPEVIRDELSVLSKAATLIKLEISGLQICVSAGRM
jgi:hypothetical protein